MKKELDEQLCKDFPLTFRDRHGDMRSTAMCWGFACSGGWEPLIRKACEKIEPRIQQLIDEGREVDGLQFKAMQVKEKFGCYDDKTFVLTNNGWKLFKDLSSDDEIATLKDGKYLEYQKPTDIIGYDYTGPMYYLHTRGVDLLVTPNHNLYVAKGTYYNGKYSPPKKVEYDFELATYEKFLEKNKRFKKSAIWIGKEEETFTLPERTQKWDRGQYGITGKHWPAIDIKMDHWLDFLGWFIAEGCVDAESLNEVSIACNNTDGGVEKSIISSAIEKTGMKYAIASEDRPALLFRLYSKQLGVWLAENCGLGAENKKIPNFVKQLPPRQIEILLKSLFAGDGHETDTANILTTVSRQLADDVSECLLKVGDTFREYKSRPPGTMISPATGKECPTKEVFEINWLKNSQDHNTSNKGMAKSSFEGMIDYSGKVYCVTVPNHVIYVRREGIPVWCGNSLRFYFTLSDPIINAAIKEAEEASEHTCEQCGAEGKLRGTGWLYTACDDCHDERLTKKVSTDTYYSIISHLKDRREDVFKTNAPGAQEYCDILDAEIRNLNVWFDEKRKKEKDEPNNE